MKPLPPARREARLGAARRREDAGLERWMAVVRLGVVPFLLIQIALVRPAYPPGIVLVAAVLGLSGGIVLALYLRRPSLLAGEPVRIAIFAVDCLAFAGALADYASPGDLTWVTYILVLLSATLRWDTRGAIAGFIVFALADLPLDVLTPGYTHLVFQVGSVTFKLGLVALLAIFFGLQFRAFRRISRDHQEQAETLRRQADTVLQSEGNLRAIFDTDLMALVAMDEDGIVKDWNRHAEEMFGRPRAEMLGCPLAETVIPRQYRQAHEVELEPFRPGGVLGQVIDITACHRSGREIPVELSISAAATVDGRATFIAFLRDITERKRGEALQALQLGVTRALSGARTLEEAAPQVLAEIGTRLNLELAQWWEVSPDGGALVWKESWAAPGFAAADFIHQSQTTTFEPGSGLLGRAWASGQAAVVADVEVEADADLPRRESAHRAGLHGALAFPVLNGVAVTGVLDLSSTRADAFTREAVRALASVGSQVGQFVERRRAEEALRAAGERITAILENVADGIITMDARGRVQSLNAEARRLFGYLPEEVIGGSVEVMVPESDRPHLLRRLLASAVVSASGVEFAGGLETVGRRMDGSTFPLELRPSEMRLAGQQVYIVSLRDISDRKAQTEALQYQALHDALTGLPNRTLLGDRLRQAIATAARDHKLLALLMLDLDRFKEVNDTMGHPYGDLILQQVASRIRDILREADTVARLGGDEFAILPTGATAREGAVRTAQKVGQALEKPFVIDDRVFDIRASIGIALYPEHGDDAETLMRRADVAMYVAKRGKKQYELYEPGQDQDTALRLALIGELRRAVERDEMILLYQPKVDLLTGEVVAVEALLRWIHPDRGTLSPDQFVVYAEQTEMINAVSRWVLDAALRQQRAWLDAGIELAMSINLSARNLHDSELPNTVSQLLTASRIPANQLIIEITEGIAMDSDAEACLQKLGAMGVRLSIDDFGTGYSSLAYLKRLPMEELKIDRSFVAGMDTSADDAAIVRPTIDLAHNLGLRVVAEGVENEATLEMLRDYGCDMAQGHHISPPRDARDLTEWLRSYSPIRASTGRPPHPDYYGHRAS
jgi:diguanylate cyclase (GGDEF)-like protein/PAS domain S-box-containing protein